MRVVGGRSQKCCTVIAVRVALLVALVLLELLVALVLLEQTLRSPFRHVASLAGTHRWPLAHVCGCVARGACGMCLFMRASTLG